MPTDAVQPSSAEPRRRCAIAAADGVAVREHDGELLAAVAREQVAGPQLGAPLSAALRSNASPAWWPWRSL